MQIFGYNSFLFIDVRAAYFHNLIIDFCLRFNYSKIEDIWCGCKIFGGCSLILHVNKIIL